VTCAEGLFVWSMLPLLLFPYFPDRPFVQQDVPWSDFYLFPVSWIVELHSISIIRLVETRLFVSTRRKLI
jgi:hypothetical protein